MSLRYEQYNALKRTRALLGQFMLAKKKDLIRTPIRELRKEVYRCLKHFPMLDDRGQPYWNEDDFTEDHTIKEE